MSKIEVDTIDTKTGTNSLTIKQNDTTAITIDTSQSVGIGTTTPSTGYGGTISNVKLALKNDGVGGNNGTSTLLIGGDNNHYSYLSSEHTGGGATYLAFGTAGGASNPVERMRITDGGDVYIGGTTNNAEGALTIRPNETFGSMLVQINRPSSTNTSQAFVFYNGGTDVGSIDYDHSGVAYTSTSDYRVKENVTDLSNATERLKQLQPKRFNFISDANKTIDGFLAHEVSDIVPEAIRGTHNEVEVWKEGEELPEGVSVGDNKLDDEGNTIPKYQGIDQSKLVPLLTASLKEAIVKIEELETRIATLENA